MSRIEALAVLRALLKLQMGRPSSALELYVAVGRDDFGQPLGVKGSGQVEGITSEDEEPRVAIDVSVASGHEAAAAAEWMRSAGAGLLAGRLAAVELRQRMLRAEAKQQRPQEEIAAKRREELARARIERAIAYSYIIRLYAAIQCYMRLYVKLYIQRAVQRGEART